MVLIIASQHLLVTPLNDPLVAEDERGTIGCSGGELSTTGISNRLSAPPTLGQVVGACGTTGG